MYQCVIGNKNTLGDAVGSPRNYIPQRTSSQPDSFFLKSGSPALIDLGAHNRDADRRHESLGTSDFFCPTVLRSSVNKMTTSFSRSVALDIQPPNRYRRFSDLILPPFTALVFKFDCQSADMTTLKLFSTSANVHCHHHWHAV